MRDGHLSLGYAGAGGASRQAAVLGEVDATFRGDTTHTVGFAARDLDVIAHHRPRGHR